MAVFEVQKVPSKVKFHCLYRFFSFISFTHGTQHLVIFVSFFSFSGTQGNASDDIGGWTFGG
jgi:hypothetical protein